MNIETTVTTHVRRALKLAPDFPVDVRAQLSDHLGMTSLQKILLLTGVCDELGLDLLRFTERDLVHLTTITGLSAFLEAKLLDNAVPSLVEGS